MTTKISPRGFYLQTAVHKNWPLYYLKGRLFRYGPNGEMEDEAHHFLPCPECSQFSVSFHAQFCGLACLIPTCRWTQCVPVFDDFASLRSAIFRKDAEIAELKKRLEECREK